MSYLIAGGAALGVLLLLTRAFIGADPRALVRTVRYGAGLTLIAIGAILGLAGRWGIGLVLVTFGMSAITVGRIGPIDLGGATRAAGSASTVRSRYLEMRLDHDSGDMTGRVLDGEHAGKALDELIERELLSLREEVGGDPESLALLEAYLDRRVPGWRDHVEGDSAAGTGGAADASAMTDEQAYEILGLLPGASEMEIRAAHRRLMKRVHPDQGGSTFLAAKINQAKDWLLSNHH
jgi:DnaJ domain